MAVKIEGANGSKKTLGICPKCKKHELIEGKKGFGCLGYKEEEKCDFTIWKESNYYKDKVIGVKEVEALLKGECIFGNLKLNDEAKLEYVQKGPIGQCPVCGKDIKENSKAFGCTGYMDKSCSFAIWKEVSGAKLTEEDAKALLSGNPTSNKTFKKKDGSGTFNATLIVKDGKVSFNF